MSRLSKLPERGSQLGNRACMVTQPRVPFKDWLQPRQHPPDLHLAKVFGIQTIENCISSIDEILHVAQAAQNALTIHD